MGSDRDICWGPIFWIGMMEMVGLTCHQLPIFNNGKKVTFDTWLAFVKQNSIQSGGNNFSTVCHVFVVSS